MQLLLRARFCREFARISIDGIVRQWYRRNNFQAHIALCEDCTNAAFAFLASPFPQLLAHMQFALVQLLFRGSFCREFTRISFADTIRRWCRRNNFQARIALCVDCTNAGFAILASRFPQILAHMQFALVQLLFRGSFCREFTRISFADTIWQWCRRNNFQARIALCALIAQTQGLRFWPPDSHSFLLICSLH